MESRHESPRSGARHWGRAGRAFLSGPHPQARATTVGGMGWCRRKACQVSTSPDSPFWGYHQHCPRPWEREEHEARVGWGRGERCTNWRNEQSGSPRRVESGGERCTNRRSARSRPAPPPMPTHGRAAPHPRQKPAEQPHGTPAPPEPPMPIHLPQEDQNLIYGCLNMGSYGHCATRRLHTAS